MTVAILLASAAALVARRDAEVLLAHTLARPRTFLMAHPDFEVDAGRADSLKALIRRRAAGGPLQYLVGTQEFFGLMLRVSPAALIPRPETELLVEAVLAWARTQPAPVRILDVGTGTGAIALAIAANLPSWQITAVDISAKALELARENAQAHEPGGRIEFLESDLLGALDRTTVFDVIVSNPPYIPSSDAATMQREVVAHEPHTALFAGADGLDVYRRLIPQAQAALRPGGLLALEFGFGQSAAIAELLRKWACVRTIDDYAGIPRVALAERVG